MVAAQTVRGEGGVDIPREAAAISRMRDPPRPIVAELGPPAPGRRGAYRVRAHGPDVVAARR